MLDQLGPEHLLLRWTDGGRTTWVRSWIERPGISLQQSIPSDGLASHTEGACCLRFAHASIDCRQDLGAQVGGIGSHSLACICLVYCANRSSPRPTRRRLDRLRRSSPRL